MDLKEWKNKALTALGRHKYALVIVVLGLVLMLLPMGSDSNQTQTIQQSQPQQQTEDIQRALERVLSKIRGAGEVDVLLTVATGAQTVYQEDADISGDEKENARYDTVIIRDSNGSEAGLVQQVIPPKYLGAVVVCKGADNAAVKLAIVEAVSKATGLGADQISVLKMK
jgi:stage III sporulation protein AG